MRGRSVSQSARKVDGNHGIGLRVSGDHIALLLKYIHKSVLIDLVIYFLSYEELGSLNIHLMKIN